MRITDRKHLDLYEKSIGKKITGLIKSFDFSESRGGFDYLTIKTTKLSTTKPLT